MLPFEVAMSPQRIRVRGELWRFRVSERSCSGELVCRFPGEEKERPCDPMVSRFPSKNFVSWWTKFCVISCKDSLEWSNERKHNILWMVVATLTLEGTPRNRKTHSVKQDLSSINLQREVVECWGKENVRSWFLVPDSIRFVARLPWFQDFQDFRGNNLHVSVNKVVVSYVCHILCEISGRMAFYPIHLKKCKSSSHRKLSSPGSLTYRVIGDVSDFIFLCIGELIVL